MLGLSLLPRLSEGVGGSYASNGLRSSLDASPALLVCLALLFGLGLLPPGRLSLAALVHDHLRRPDVGAVGLGDGRGPPRGARAAIGRAAGHEVGHGGVLFERVRGEGVGCADGLLEHKANGRRCAPRDAQRGVRLEEGRVA